MESGGFEGFSSFPVLTINYKTFKERKAAVFV